MRYLTGLFLFFLSALSAKPSELPTVITGEVNVIDALHIQAKDHRSILNWKDFSIALEEVAKFDLPSKDAAILNRVLGGDVSSILGRIESNGHILLINPSGIIFGPDAVIDTSSFLASTLDILDQDFIENRMAFRGISDATLINYGTIRAWDGDVTLIGYKVEDAGHLEAPQGAVSLFAGREVYLQPNQDEHVRIKLSLDQGEDGVGILQTGTIQAVEARLVADGNPYAYAIKQEGTITTTGLEQRGGKIFVVGTQGTSQSAGTLVAKNFDKTGGEVRILGCDCKLVDQAKIDVSGESGGGTILIGGNFQGKDPSVENAQTTYVGKDVSLLARAYEEGDGGKVIVWADDITHFYGHIDGRGGAIGGDGGFAEVSGKENLYFSSIPKLAATNGKNGTLLLDPTNIEITAVPPTSGSFSGGTYQPILADPNNILNSDIEAILNGGTNVYISAFAGNSVQNGSITVSASINWTTATQLWLDGFRSTPMEINAAITNTGGGSLLVQAGPLQVTAPISMTGGVGESHNLLLSAESNITADLTSSETIRLDANYQLDISGCTIMANNFVIGAAPFTVTLNNVTMNVANGANFWAWNNLKILNNSSINAGTGVRFHLFARANKVGFEIAGSSVTAPEIEIFSPLLTTIRQGSSLNATNNIVITPVPVVNWQLGNLRDPFNNIAISNSTIAGGRLLFEGREIGIQGSTLSGSQALMRSRGTTAMLGSTLSTTGFVKIIVDSKGDDPLKIGTGSFQMGSASSITGSTINIWTARQPFNNILGTLNGVSFTPGLLYANSSQEHWRTFFPMQPLTGSPFAIYYKDNGQVIITDLTLVGQNPFIRISEMQQEILNPFDEYLALSTRFDMVYNPGNKQDEPGWLTSFQDGEDRRYFIRRRTFYGNRALLIPPPWGFFEEVPKRKQESF